MIKITEEADEFIKTFLRKESTKETFTLMCKFDAKLVVEKAGCSGKKFALKPISVREVVESKLISTSSRGVHIWTTEENYELVKDCTIELEKDSINTKLRISNPSITTGVCGCGESYQLELL